MSGVQGRSGGKRLGAGRRPGQGFAFKRYALPKARSMGLTPLEYMLTVMNDDQADANRRDRMAMAAAPYCHGKVSDQRVTKGELRAEQAKDGGEWASDLTPGIHHAGIGASEYHRAGN